VLAGLWSGLLIGYVTEYYTSHAYKPVREVADASRTGSSRRNIIYGLSLGLPVIVHPRRRARNHRLTSPPISRGCTALPWPRSA